MRRAGLGLFGLSLVVALPTSASAESPERQAVLVLLEDVSYEDVLGDPALRMLARSGGVGLMTTAAATPGRPAEYVTLGAGAVAGAPAGAVEAVRDGTTLSVDPAPYRALSPAAVPGALAEAVKGSGRSVGYIALNVGRTDARGIVVAMDEEGRVERGVIEGEFGDVVWALRSGALAADFVVIEPGLPPGPGLGQALSFFAERATADEVLLVVTSPEPSREMLDQRDQMSPVVVVAGEPGGLLREIGPLRGLTSRTTGIDGVVANVDVAPTILDFLDVPVPESMTGSPIRVEGEPPTDLHKRYLEYQRSLRPIGITALLVVLVTLGAGGAFVLFARRAPRGVASALAAAGLFGVALQVAMLPGSYLPEFDLPLVLGALAGGAALVTIAGLWLGSRDPAFAPVAVVGGVGVALVALDAALGWPSLLTPLLGGSALDGVRFYGLGNSYAGVLLAGVVLVAALLPLSWGAALIVAAGLFAGLPWIGADLGGGLTLFAVAGLRIALRGRGRLDLAGIGIVAAAFVLGFALILGAHWLADDPTHVTRATTGPGGLAGIAGTFWERLRLNLEATAATPVVWPALLGLPAWFVVAWRRAGPFGPPLEGNEAWRDAVIALAVGGMLGYVLNDTFGMASIAFLYLSLAMVFPGLRWKSA